MMSEPTIHYVPICCLEELSDKIAKLNKKATKLNTPPIEMSIGERSVRYEICEFGDKKAWVSAVLPHHNATGRVLEFAEVTVTGTAPKYDGWEFVATLEPMGEENIIRSIDDSSDLSEYRDRIGECDHCKKIRQRKDTYVVRHDDGRTVMVGKQCLKDFLGHQNPNQLAAWATIMFSLDELFMPFCDPDGYGGRSESSWELVEFLGYVAGFCSGFGWTSGSDAHESMGHKVSTANQVIEHLSKPAEYRNSEWHKVEEKVAPGPKDYNKAAEAIEWALNHEHENLNDYLENLRVIAKAGYSTKRTAGYAASMVSAHGRYLSAKLERERRNDRPDSHHVGSVKERLDLTVTCDAIFESEGHYGVTGIHKLTDDKGNDLTWFASGSAHWLDVGTTYEVKATVKSHGEYRDRAQTVVNRVKIVKDLSKVVDFAC